MSGSRRPLTLLIVGLMIAISVYCARWIVVGMPEGDSQGISSLGTGLPFSASVDSATALATARARADAAIDDAVLRLSGRSKAGTRSKPIQADAGCDWPQGFKRGTSSLPAILLFGHLSSADIARHELLNEADVVLCPQDILELDTLVADYNAAVDPVLSAYRTVRVAEKVACIEAGVVKPWDPPSEPESQVAARAAALMAERDMSEAEARAEAIKLLRSAPEAPPGNYLKHDGRIYLSSDFPALPKTAAVYENVKFLVGEHAAVLIAWFVQRGLCTDPATPGRILEGISKKPAK